MFGEPEVISQCYAKLVLARIVAFAEHFGGANLSRGVVGLHDENRKDGKPGEDFRVRHELHGRCVDHDEIKMLSRRFDSIIVSLKERV